MPRKRDQAADEELLTVQANVRKLTGSSVNAWAKKHGFVQTTINRIVTGQNDVTVTMLVKIARAAKIEPWQLLEPDFGVGLYRLAVTPKGATVPVPVEPPEIAWSEESAALVSLIDAGAARPPQAQALEKTAGQTRPSASETRGRRRTS